jgi:hypothetical protein
LGVAGSVASVAGLLIAWFAERRASSADRRAKSAEEKVDAAVARTRTAADVRALAVAYTAARLALAAKASRPAWAAHVADLRKELGILCESAVLSTEDRREAQLIAAAVSDLTYRDPVSDRTLERAAERLNRLSARGLNRLSGPAESKPRPLP